MFSIFQKDSLTTKLKFIFHYLILSLQECSIFGCLGHLVKLKMFLDKQKTKLVEVENVL